MRNQSIRLLPAFALAMFDIAQFPAALQPMIQVGYLETSFEDYLTANNGYWEAVDNDTFKEDIYEQNRGVTITRTRPGLKAPVVVAADPTAAQTPPNDGVTASDFAIEQYTFAPFELTDGIDMDLIGTNFAIVNRFQHDVKVSYHQAVQSMDLLARDTYLYGYATSHTLTTAAISGANVHCDDIRGLSTVITVGANSTNGVLTAVSTQTPLPVLIYSAAASFANTPYTANVTAAVPDNANISDYVLYGAMYGSAGAPTNARGNGISGTLTLANVSGSYSVAQGDVIVAGDAPIQLFSGGAVHFSQVTSNLTQALLLDAVGYLQNNAVPFAQNAAGDDEGTYICHLAPSVRRSLYNDPDFKQANQTLGLSEIYKKGKVSQYVGVTFLENTNAPRVALAPYGGKGYAYCTLVVGQGAIIDSPYEGLEFWASNMLNPSYTALNRGIAQILMPAYADRQGRRIHIDWLTIRDMVCPTDVTRASVVLTGTAGRRARAVAIWTWSAT